MVAANKPVKKPAKVKLLRSLKTYGLFIGINDYPGTGMDLRGCVNDAKDWAAVIGPFCDEVVMLLDKDATRQNMLGEARRLIAKMKHGDRFAGTNSSHGTWKPDLDGDEPDGRDECLVPYDYQNLISDDELHLLFMNRAQGTDLFFVSDSCHSGTMHRLMRPSDNENKLYEMGALARMRFLDPLIVGLTKAEQEAVPLYARRLRGAKPLFAPGVKYLSGCDDTEFSYDATIAGRNNGAMTAYALKALSATRKGSSYDTWHRRLTSVYLPSYQYPQRPKLQAGDTEKKEAIWFRA